jgi:hypothetical protein
MWILMMPLVLNKQKAKSWPTGNEGNHGLCGAASSDECRCLLLGGSTNLANHNYGLSLQKWQIKSARAAISASSVHRLLGNKP